ncbi:SusC/RagA family TonB-linked outer membrane protein [Flagellimonas zhangzhouensis]|uniref:TonB-linked outer membrane protein, SusC/RagA family n=1 Tax=Flagellimonas zhangzhouensis TaxID=1073328 RepID=A0A1H2QAM2_9FLAO|nr:TonB-dependent receptor [Allomuricauda zhangzhouensis]SDQ50780.1 TonB-linked outer membrane protein, SusC/RagA family [Allomuricauda zhangzhouensis]SDW04172.1 TonB-linked outer membrane protein, SusC/RagA family [Allomuricauda zhangzhouensis]
MLTNTQLLKKKLGILSRIWLLPIFFLFLGLQGQAQDLTITGVVSEAATGTPIPGVNILVKGTTNGVVTDFDGNYAIKAATGDVLIFSYVGFESQEIVVGSSSAIDVGMVEDTNELDEVVIIGYGSQKKSDLTGSVAVVDTEDAKKLVTHDVAKMIQGQAPGVTVQSSGEPGGFVNIKIRGISSFSNNNPLFVVDGMLVDDPFDFATGEIESIQVLKDASSAAIYGVRGANGVIIITTKKGSEGKLDITYKSSIGFQNVTKTIPLTDRVGYQNITNAAYVNSGQAILPGNDSTNPLFIDNVSTNWQDEAYRTGVLENHSLTFTGGSSLINYNLNVDYFKNTGYLRTPQAYERYSTVLNLGGAKGKFSYGSRLSYTRSDKENFNEYLAGTSSIINLLQAIPTMPVYDENRLGGYGGADNLTQRAITLNVIGYNNLITNENLRNRFAGNIWGEYEIIKGLKYTLRASYDRLDWHDRYFNPPSDLGWYYITTPDEAALNVNTGNRTRTVVDNLLAYDVDLGKHNISALLGWIQQRDDFYRHTSRAVGYDVETIPQLNYGASQSAAEFQTTQTAVSYISRLNYGYDDKYLVTANFRRDKTSLFREELNTGDYYSFSGAWKVHNESWVNLPDWWETLKVRGGYGVLGNNTVAPYAYSPTVNAFANYVFNNELVNGTTVVTATDPNLKWEDTKTVNAAIEVGMFNNKLQFSAEYFEKKSTDILADVPLPLSSGSINSAWGVVVRKNAADVKNNGMEFTMSYNNQDHEFKYNISANLGTLKNEVLRIGENDNPISVGEHRTEVGRSIGEIYAYETDGLFQSQEEIDAHASQPGAQPGDVKFKDLNNDGFINDEDRSFQGVTIPKYSYGLNFSADYKNFDFSMFWQGQGGNKIYNGTYNALMIGGLLNHHTDMLDYWTPTNTDTNIPRPDVTEANANARSSDRFVEKGDYIRLQTIQLGYVIPTEKIAFLNHMRVYVSAQNLLTITNYRGYDPDFASDGLFRRGFEFGSFPNPRTLSLGMEVKF